MLVFFYSKKNVTKKSLFKYDKMLTKKIAIGRINLNYTKEGDKNYEW